MRKNIIKSMYILYITFRREMNSKKKIIEHKRYDHFCYKGGGVEGGGGISGGG